MRVPLAYQSTELALNFDFEFQILFVGEKKNPREIFPNLRVYSSVARVVD